MNDIRLSVIVFIIPVSGVKKSGMRRTKSEKTSLLFLPESGQKNGSPGGNRTHDPLLRRQLLYPLSYRTTNVAYIILLRKVYFSSHLTEDFAYLTP